MSIVTTPISRAAGMAAQLAEQVKAAQDAADATALKLDAKIQQLMAATPAQIRARLNTAIDSTSNATVVSSLRDELALIESVLGVLARRL